MTSEDPVIRDLETMSVAHNYNAWLYSQFRAQVGRRIIEVGAGIGNITSLLSDRDLVVATDVYGPCIEYLHQRFAGVPSVVPLLLDISTSEARQLKVRHPDTIVCLNVLEHVEDDAAALENMFYLLERGGRLALLVPAFQMLYGTIDHLVGHRRRYTRRGLGEKLIAAGFKVQRLYYMNSLAVFGWYWNNRIMKREEESPAQVAFFDKTVVPWLSVIEQAFHPPFGLSVVAIATKESV